MCFNPNDLNYFGEYGWYYSKETTQSTRLVNWTKLLNVQETINMIEFQYLQNMAYFHILEGYIKLKHVLG